jgi:hypothetical protein
MKEQRDLLSNLSLSSKVEAGDEDIVEHHLNEPERAATDAKGGHGHHEFGVVGGRRALALVVGDEDVEVGPGDVFSRLQLAVHQHVGELAVKHNQQRHQTASGRRGGHRQPHQNHVPGGCEPELFAN